MRASVVMLCLAAPLVAHAGSSADLYVLVLAGGVEKQTQTIARYRFDGAAEPKREDLFTSYTSDLRFDIGRTALVGGGRYLAGGWGEVLDLKRGRLVRKRNKDQELVSWTETSLLYRDRLWLDGDLAYEEYDPSDGASKVVLTVPLAKGAFFGGDVFLSPDRKRVAIAAQADGMLGIWIAVPGEKPRLLVRASASVGVQWSGSPRPPMCWIDDERIMTQRDNGFPIVVGLDGHVTEFEAVSCPFYEWSGEPDIFRAPNGDLVYSCEKDYVVDADARSVAAMEARPLGWGFTHTRIGRRDRFSREERILGAFWSLPYETETADGWLATLVSQQDSVDASDYRDLAVWSAAAGRWTTLHPGLTTRILGWVVP